MYGLNGKLLKWIQGFLSGRTMRVGPRGTFSEFLRLLSGVPQGSVLGPLLFLLYVNDLPEWIISSMRIFADDVKLWITIKSEQDSVILQSDLDSLTCWLSTYHLKFNLSKCKVMHIGNKTDINYHLKDDLGEHRIDETTIKRDLGNNLKPSAQCVKAAKARSILGMIKRNFRRIDEEDFLVIYKAYIRPHLEYCVQTLSPHMQKDIHIFEKIQRSATKIVHRVKHLCYEVRLDRLGLTTLFVRQKRGDLIETYKILTEKENIEKEQFFELTNNGYFLRGHTMKLVVSRPRLDIRKYFFSQRVVAEWNRLPEQVVTAPSVNTFKNWLDKH